MALHSPCSAARAKAASKMSLKCSGVGCDAGAGTRELRIGGGDISVKRVTICLPSDTSSMDVTRLAALDLSSIRDLFPSANWAVTLYLSGLPLYSTSYSVTENHPERLPRADFPFHGSEELF